MQEFIARENIKRFRQQLENCTDERQRATLKDLLEQEEAHLAEMKGEAADSAQPLANPTDK